MKLKISTVIVFILLAALFFLPSTPVLAAASVSAAPGQLDLVAIFVTCANLLKGMISVGFVIQLAVGYGKYRGWIKDEDTRPAILIVNGAVIVIFAVLKIYAPTFDLHIVETYAALIVDSSGALGPVALLFISVFSKVFYDQALRGTPIFGYSYTLESQKRAEQYLATLTPTMEMPEVRISDAKPGVISRRE